MNRRSKEHLKEPSMKATLTKSQIDRTSQRVPLEVIPMACLLVIASLLAIAGGMATATLFFGLLLTFALLVIAIRPRRSSGKKGR
jgi:hypothetical protein